jgi:hypothetical protein
LILPNLSSNDKKGARYRLCNELSGEIMKKFCNHYFQVMRLVYGSNVFASCQLFEISVNIKLRKSVVYRYILSYKSNDSNIFTDF